MGIAKEFSEMAQEAMKQLGIGDAPSTHQIECSTHPAVIELAAKVGCSVDDILHKTFTAEQIYTALGHQAPWFSKRVVKLGLQPVEPSYSTQEGAVPARWNFAQFAIFQEEEERKMAEARERAADAAASRLNEAVKQHATTQTLDKLDDKGIMTLILTGMMRLSQRMDAREALLEQRNAELESENAELSETANLLSIQVDYSRDYFTVLRTGQVSMPTAQHNLMVAKAIELGFTDGSLPYGWKTDVLKEKRYARIQVKDAGSRFPAWAYHKDVWAQFGYEPSDNPIYLRKSNITLNVGVCAGL